jgi:hypothetical protein
MLSNEELRLPTKRAMITAIFVATSLASVLLILGSTLNYIEFYKAIEELGIQVLGINTSISQNNVNVSLTFSVTNPTRYASMKLREVSFVLRYETNGSYTDLLSDTLSYSLQPLPVGAYWNETFQYQKELDVKRETTASFVQAHEAHHGKLVWKLDCTAILITFVDTTDVPMSSHFSS